MPTGYTRYIESEEITTGKEFLKLCTRAFGVAISLRDEPLSVPTPSVFEVDPRYESRYEEALKELESALNMSIVEAKSQIEMKHKEDTAYYNNYVKRATKINSLYDKVRKEIEEWTPPTEEHNSIKEFALNQIDVSITDKEIIDDFVKYANKDLKNSDKDAIDYIREYIKKCRSDVERTYSIWQEEVQSIKKKNEWIKCFLDSLEN